MWRSPPHRRSVHIKPHILTSADNLSVLPGDLMNILSWFQSKADKRAVIAESAGKLPAHSDFTF